VATLFSAGLKHREIDAPPARLGRNTQRLQDGKISLNIMTPRVSVGQIVEQERSLTLAKTDTPGNSG
jgi:hypothetical protein